MHQFSSYKPLLIIFLYIIFATACLPFVEVNNYMQNFMGLILLTFSYFKIINLQKFSESFIQYDPLAKIFKPYSSLYPFLEVILGVGFLTAFNIKYVSILTALVTGIGAYGILQTIKSKQIIECACLGMVFKFPLSKVSLIENLVMCVMSVSIYLSI